MLQMNARTKPVRHSLWLIAPISIIIVLIAVSTTAARPIKYHDQVLNSIIPAKPAVITPTLFVVPDTIAPQGDVILIGYGLAPTGTYVVSAIGSSTYPFGIATSDANGNLQQILTVPSSIPPGGYALALNDPNVISPSLRILPSVTLTLSPSLGSPGTIVTFTVDHLTLGSLRLDYAGVPIRGPSSVGDTTFTGTFIVPDDRPNPISSTTVITAINLAGNQAIGRTTATFHSLDPISPTIYSIVNLSTTVPNAAGGELITITGQISPSGSLSQQYGALSAQSSAAVNSPFNASKLKVMWQTPNSQTFPLTPMSTTVSSNGNFKFVGSLPSLFNGDALPSSPGSNSVKVGLGNAIPNYTIVPIKNPPALRFRVVNTASQPISNAVVSIDPKSLLGQASLPPPSVGTPLANFEANAPNQLAIYVDNQSPKNKDPFSCPPTNLSGRTDASGYFTPTLDWDALLGMLGQTMKINMYPKQIYYQTSLTTTFYFYVNAQWQGYGTVLNGGAQIYNRTLGFSKVANSFFDPVNQHSINSDPITVILPKLPAGVHADIPIVYQLDGVKKTIPWFNGSTLTVYGTYLSFQSIVSHSITAGGNSLSISFNHSDLEDGTLDHAEFYVDGQDKGSFYTGLVESGCTIGSPISYRFDFNNAWLLSPGFHIAQIAAHAMSGFVTTQTFLLQFADAPTWIFDSSLSDQSALWRPSVDGSVLQATHLPANAPSSTSVLTATVPKVGFLNNSAGGDGYLMNYIKTSGDSQFKNIGHVDTTALNTTAPPQPTNKSVIGGNPIIIPETTLSILDTGWFPLFRDSWGLWPIASATVGADMAFQATLHYLGSIQIQPILKNILNVDPEATVKIDAWLDVSALFGLIDAQAHALPHVSVSLPMAVTNGSVTDSDKCFLYKLDIAWSASVGKCPFCASDSGTKNIFSGRTPNSPLCNSVPLQASIIPPLATSVVTTPKPSGIDPSIATDGFGHTLAVWSDDNHDLQYNPYNGSTWSTPQYLLANAASIHPAIAFYAPNKAVAVWSQTDFTTQTQKTATLTDTVKSQHLAYAIWNGGFGWSAPVSLTSPSSGDGAVTLIGCMSTQATCPSGGEVTASWVHDAIGDLAARQFRVYYSKYHNGSWSAIQPVDGTSTATDDEPTAVYSGTYPLVVWVRDADRDLSTLDDRRITYRYLDGSSPVITVTDLPTGTLEPSAAIDAKGQLKLAFTVSDDPNAFTGNQRSLYSAKQTCAGSCTWTVQKLVDNHNRSIHAEHPILTLNANGNGIITFRGVGFGQVSGDFVSFPEDPIGMVSLTGEAAQVQVDFATTTHSPSYLSSDGAVNWHPAAVFDPLQLQTHVVSVKGAAPILSAQLKAQHASSQVRFAPHTTQAVANNPSLVFFDVPQAADLIVEDVTPWPDRWNPQFVLFHIRNAGPITSNVQAPVKIVASWDGMPSVGTFAGLQTISSVAPDQEIYSSINLAPSVDLTIPHTLYVTINPTLTTPEINVANNTLTTTAGGLPAPTNLEAYGQQGSSIVYLYWQPGVFPIDDRTAGYRIYRSTDGGPIVPIGSAFDFGYADVTADLNHTYQYFVTTYNVDGVESDVSVPIKVTTNSFKIFLPHISKNH